MTPCRLEDLIAVVAEPTSLDRFPTASAVQLGALVYDAGTVRDVIATPHGRAAVLAELAAAFSDGPGIIVVRGAVERAVVDRVNAAFATIIDDQRRANASTGDHFGAPGANDRVWNALEKLAIVDPDAFVAYYANDMIALGAMAWLGPGYQITSQVNVVNPGGQAQAPHRDYHLGFMTDEMAAQYPPHVHLLSPSLTLQGAIAHVDMPVESGPTLYLPHSHKYADGYLAWRRQEFIDYFDRHHVQLPLACGDLVYFNPALFHAAGTNHSSGIRRAANLLQVNSAFGRAMESVDRTRLTIAVYPALQRARHAGVSDDDLLRAVAASAEGYAFPSNLDRDQPNGRLTPITPAETVLELLHNDAPVGDVALALAGHATRRNTSG